MGGGGAGVWGGCGGGWGGWGGGGGVSPCLFSWFPAVSFGSGLRCVFCSCVRCFWFFFVFGCSGVLCLLVCFFSVVARGCGLVYFVFGAACCFLFWLCVLVSRFFLIELFGFGVGFRWPVWFFACCSSFVGGLFVFGFCVGFGGLIFVFL